MRKKMMLSMAAAAAIEFAVMTTTAYPQIQRAAKHAQGLQIEKKDVLLDNTTRGARQVARTDDRARKALTDADLKASLQDARFGEAKAVGTVCPKWICGANSPIVDGAAIVAQPARRHQTQQLTERDVVIGDTRRGDRPVARTNDRVREAHRSPGFKAGVQSARFGEAMVGGLCGWWVCGSNSPIVDGAAIVAQPARRHQSQQLTVRDVVISRGDRPVAGRNDRERKALKSPSFKAGLQSARFGEAFGLNLNSPIVDGAAIVARPARRHRCS